MTNAEVQDPEAISVPETPVEETVLPTLPDEGTVSDPVEEEGLRTYRANWKLDGLASGPLGVGDTVELDPEDAAPLVDCGVLSIVEGDSAQCT